MTRPEPIPLLDPAFDLETFADADDFESEDFWPAHPAPQRHAIDMEALG